MAITGVVDADILTISRKLGVSRRAVADALAYTYETASVVLTDAGGHAGHLVITNMWGLLTIDWGDGTITRQAASSAGALTPANHTYAAGGSKTVRVYGLARQKNVTATIA